MYLQEDKHKDLTGYNYLLEDHTELYDLEKNRITLKRTGPGLPPLPVPYTYNKLQSNAVTGKINK